MSDGEISIMEALNQIQSWLNAGEFEKVIQGCQEILAIEPGNQRALALLKQAESARHEEESEGLDSLDNLMVEEPPTPQATPTPAPAPQTEAPTQEALKEETKTEDYDFYRSPRPSGKKMFLAMVIPAIIVVVLGGLLIQMLNNAKREEILGDQDTEEPPTSTDETPRDEPLDTSYLAENEQRVLDLTEMADAIEEYYADQKKFPTPEEVMDLLETELDKVPQDPRHGESDKSGDLYGYVYAVYDLNGVENGTYILSALFEDSKGEAHPWAQGASTKNYDDFRDLDASHVILLGELKK